MLRGIPSNTSYQVIGSGGNMWKYIWAPLILVILFLFVPKEMILLIQGMIILGFTISIGIGSLWVMSWYEDYKIKKAERLTKEMQGRFIVTPNGVWNVAHPKWDVVRLTDSPFIRNNGHDRPLTEDEQKYHLSKIAPKVIQGESIPIINQQLLLEESKIDLLDLIDQYPHTHIYGTTGGGKTSLLRTIAYRRQTQGHQVLVLDSTEHPAQWKDLTRIRKREKQNEVIGKLFSIYKMNEEALSTGKAIESDFKQITILSDEWTDIVEENELAKRFIREQIRKVRKFGLHLVFATQTDLAEDLGLSGAYKTTTSFLKLELKKLPEGRYVAIARVGYKQLGEFDVPAPPPLPELPKTDYIAPTLESVKVIKPKPSPYEQRIIDLYNSGIAITRIGEIISGTAGGNQSDKVKTVLHRWGICNV